MRETETFEYIRQKYPDKEEKWRKVTQLVNSMRIWKLRACMISTSTATYQHLGDL